MKPSLPAVDFVTTVSERTHRNIESEPGGSINLLVTSPSFSKDYLVWLLQRQEVCFSLSLEMFLHEVWMCDILSSPL